MCLKVLVVTGDVIADFLCNNYKRFAIYPCMAFINALYRIFAFWVIRNTLRCQVSGLELIVG